VSSRNPEFSVRYQSIAAETDSLTRIAARNPPASRESLPCP
jgi:hypothetical protein